MIENSEIKVADIIRMQARLASYLTTYLPNINLQPGSAMYDIVIKSMAHVLALFEKEASEIQSRYNIEALATMEDTTSRLMMDDVLSNWFIQRKVGGLSTVSITIELSAPLAITLDNTYIFTRSEGVSFSPASTFSRSYSIDDYREYTSSSGLTVYGLTVQVSANNFGMGSSLPPGEFTLNKAIPGFIRAYSNKVSTTVTSNETNYQLLQRAKESLSYRGLTTPKSIIATINDLELPNLSKVEVIKAGDNEMFRDLINASYETAVNIHSLGKVDVLAYLDKVPTDTAVLSTNSNGELSLPKDSPLDSVYYVSNVRKAGVSLVGVSFKEFLATDGSTKYLKHSRSIDDTTSKVVETISTVASTALSEGEYQIIYGDYLASRGTTSESITVRFSSQQSNIVVEYTKAYNLSLVEDLLKSDDLAPVSIDMLAKLPSLVEVRINKIKYSKNLNSPIGAVPETLIKGAVASFISNYTGILNNADIAKYITDNFYQYISSVQSDISIEYTLHSSTGFKFSYKNSASSNLSIEELSNLVSVTDPTFGYTHQTTLEYLNSIGTSDRTITYYCDSFSIYMEQQ